MISDKSVLSLMALTPTAWRALESGVSVPWGFGCA